MKLRFRIMTEVKKESNLLNKSQYPDILDNPLNFIVPLHKETDEEDICKKAKKVFLGKQPSAIKKLKIKHHFNGYFFVFQSQL